MKLLIVALLASAVVALAAASPFLDPELSPGWESWKKFHNKSYGENEEVWRRVVWEENLKMITVHNLEESLGNHTWRMGMNRFGDMTNEEFQRSMLCFGAWNDTSDDSAESTFVPPASIEVPSSIDWNKLGYVTRVKNQGSCGSCWAFSTTGSVEGQHRRKTGALVSLSEQNLVDCSRNQGNFGCRGGLMTNAFKYIIKNRGIDSEASYPYRGQDQLCQYNPKYNAARISGYMNISPRSEAALKAAVGSVGPVSVAIDATLLSFQFYHSGVYKDAACTKRLSHGVLAVGYGVAFPGQKYWLVKNSWGTGWGESGYVRMARDYNNLCGIASAASYPLA